MPENLNPAEFNIEDWLTDAHLPEESAEVYKRPDVISELSSLKRQITIAREAAAVEKTAGENSELSALEKRYDELVETFGKSQLTIYVRACSPDEIAALRKSHDERTKGWDPKEANADFGYDLLSAGICAVRPFEGERIPVQWSVEQVKKIEATIGGSQMSLVLEARQRAQNATPRVDADFLHKPSGLDAGRG